LGLGVTNARISVYVGGNTNFAFGFGKMRAEGKMPGSNNNLKRNPKFKKFLSQMGTPSAETLALNKQLLNYLSNYLSGSNFDFDDKEWDSLFDDKDKKPDKDDLSSLATKAKEMINRMQSKMNTDRAEKFTSVLKGVGASIDGSTLVIGGLASDDAAQQRFLQTLVIGLGLLEKKLPKFVKGYFPHLNGSTDEDALGFSLDNYKEFVDLIQKSPIDWLCQDLNGDYDVEATDPLRSLDLSALVICLYEINDIFKAGVVGNIGYSFRELNLKDTSIKMNESLLGKIGLAIGVTDYFQLHLGLGAVKRGISFNKDTEYEDQYNLIKTKYSSSGFQKVSLPNIDDTANHIALYGFINLLAILPINENWSLFANLGYQSDFNTCDVDIGGASNLKLTGLSHANVGLGFLYKIV